MNRAAIGWIQEARGLTRWAAVLVLCAMLGMAWAPMAYAQASAGAATTTLAEAIKTAERELADATKKRADKAKELAETEAQIRNAEAANDAERVKTLRARANTFGEELNKLDLDVIAKEAALESKYTELRATALKDLVDQVKAANDAVVNDPKKAGESLQSADKSFDEWKRGVEKWKAYQHTEEELVQPSQLEANRKRAESERERLRAGLERLKAERDLEASELKVTETLIGKPVAHAEWGALSKKLEALKETLGKRKTDIDSRIKAGEQRMKAIEDYLK